MDKSYFIAVGLIVAGFITVMIFFAPDAPVLPVVIVAGAVGALFFLFWFFGTYLPLRRFAPLQRRFGFTASKRRPEVITGVWGGRPVRAEYHEFKRHERAKLSVWLSVRLPVGDSVVFTPERFHHRWVKGVGLTREAQSGDPTFDPYVFVAAERDAGAERLVGDASVRQVVLRLLRVRRAAVTIDRDGVGVMIKGHLGWGKYFSPERFQQILASLSALSDSVGRAAETRPVAKAVAPIEPDLGRIDFSEGRTLGERLSLLADPGRFAIFAACLLMFVGPLALLWGSFYPTLTWRLQGVGLGIAAVLLVFHALLVFRFVRGQSRSHRHFATFLFAALIGFPTFCVGTAQLVNGALDGAAPVAVPAEVLKAADEGGRLEVRVYAGEMSGTVSVRVLPDLFRVAKPGEVIPVVVAPGALGEPWLIGVAPAEWRPGDRTPPGRAAAGRR